MDHIEILKGWLKSKTPTINPKRINDISFQYTITVVVNHRTALKDPQNISKIKPFISKYSWKEINFQSHKNNWKKFETSNKAIALDKKPKKACKKNNQLSKKKKKKRNDTINK